jgi:hypothetical protein
MSTLACIVEGDGVVGALPELLRRIIGHLVAQDPATPWPQIPFPIRIKKGSFVAADGQEYRAKYLALAKARAGDDGYVLVVLDADDDCPAQLSNMLLTEMALAVAPVRLAFVVAKREFESWFLAAAESISGMRLLEAGLVAPADPENAIANAKGWLRDRMPDGSTYSETIDQPALAATFDWQAAMAKAPSLDKLYREIAKLLAVAD